MEPPVRTPPRYVPTSSEDSGAFGSLPDEIVVIVGSHLSAADLTRFALLSRRFGLDRGPMRTSDTDCDNAWSSLAEQSAKRAYFHRHEYFRSLTVPQSWSKPFIRGETRSSFLVTLADIEGYCARICIDEAGPEAVVSDGGDNLRAARASRFVCQPRTAFYPGVQRVEFTLVKSGQHGARVGLVARNRELNSYVWHLNVDWQKIDDGEDGNMDICEQRTWLFDTESGCLVHSDPRSVPREPCVIDRPWGHGDGTSFVKEGSVVGMELRRDRHNSLTFTVDIDGRHLGELVTQEDHSFPETEDHRYIAPIPNSTSLTRVVRWCGIASAGAELRISGPKPPASG